MSDEFVSEETNMWLPPAPKGTMSDCNCNKENRKAAQHSTICREANKPVTTNPAPQGVAEIHKEIQDSLAAARKTPEYAQEGIELKLDEIVRQARWESIDEAREK